MSALYYSSYKCVVLRDRRIGIIYYIILMIIMLYIFADIMVYKSYLEVYTSTSGNLRLIANSRPLEDHEEHMKINLKYCCGLNQTSSYCKECKALDALSMNWPSESKALNIAAYVVERWEKAQNNDTDPQEFVVLWEDKFFTLNPEHVFIKIEHSIYATSSSANSFAASHRFMNGWIIRKNGTKLRELNSDGSRRADKIRLFELLQAAGVDSLDNKTDALNARHRTYRQNGIVLHVNIHYDNTQNTLFGTSDTVYTYNVQKVPFSDYKVKQEIPVVDVLSFKDNINISQINTRIVRKRFCIRVEFTKSAQIGKFSLIKLVRSLGSGAGMISLAAVIVDLLIAYMFPAKYQECIYEHSPLFEQEINKKTN